MNIYATIQWMTHFRLPSALLLSLGICATAQVRAGNYTPGAQHLYTHESGDVPADTYQYSVWVPKGYALDYSYPVVFFLHGGDGRKHPGEATKNMVADRLLENKLWTAPGYSGNAPIQFSKGYLHVAPVRPGTHWEADKFKRLLDHVKSKVNIDMNRVYVTGFSMGGQGAWQVASLADPGCRIAAIMPIAAWGCNEVQRGTTPETCRSTKTPVWVQHCPFDDVSKISEQISLFQNHLDCGGYGRFTMMPGKGHLDRPGDNDKRAFYRGFDIRMAWMLSQTYGTPFNYSVQVDSGVILEAASGVRHYIGDTARYGFFEPGTVIRITAPETRDGKRFVKWASPTGKFADPAARTATYTTAGSDTQIMAIFGTGPVKLSVVGGTAKPANPQPGDTVTVTANADAAGGANRFLYWTTDYLIDIPFPYQRSFTFSMPSRDVTITARLNAAE